MNSDASFDGHIFLCHDYGSTKLITGQLLLLLF